MSTDFDSRQAATEAVELFKQAEGCIKTLETLYSEGLAFHPVNQLRYAGYHMAQAFQETDPSKQKDIWKEAIRHCKRAIYDASEMAISYCLSEYGNFKSDYGTLDFSPSIPDYLDIVGELRKAQDIIKSTKYESREDRYKDCRDQFEIIKPLVDRLNDARPELNKRLDDRWRNRSVAASGMLLALLTLLVAFFAWVDWSPTQVEHFVDPHIAVQQSIPSAISPRSP